MPSSTSAATAVPDSWMRQAAAGAASSAPYHAWTWDNRGTLLRIRHGEVGFPGADRGTLGLKRLGCAEVHGWVWVAAGTDAAPDIGGFLDGLAADFAWLDAGSLKIAHEEIREWAVNWKILVEGAIESYHFSIAHKNTVGPYFLDSQSSYRVFGRHIRSVLPRTRFDAMMARPRESWSLRRETNLVYVVFPSAMLLVQEDHAVWVQALPLAPDRTRVRLVTLVPADFDPTDAEAALYWRKNHDITVRTLTEDFVIGESIQSGLPCGANDVLHFGRFEGALDRFNRIVERELGGGTPTPDEVFT